MISHKILIIPQFDKLSLFFGSIGPNQVTQGSTNVNSLDINCFNQVV